MAIAVVGAVSVGAIGIASAAGEDVAAGTQPSSEPAPEKEHDGPGPWRGGWGGPWGGPWGGGLDGILGEGVEIADILHSEVVLAKEGGGTQTVLVQKGAVTEVSATSVTVRSADGHTRTYAVNGDTRVKADSDEIGAVAANEEVLVVAPRSGETQTATVLVDLTDLGWK